MSFAQEKIRQVKKDLIGFIKFETDLISRAVNNDTDEEGPYTEEEDWVWNPAVNVGVDNSYLDIDDYCTERRKVVSISIVEEEGISETKVVVTTEEDDEIYAENLSVEELGAICDCLAKSYESLTKHD